MTETTREQIARQLGTYGERLRSWEACGLLPEIDTVPLPLYRDRATLIVAARKVLSMPRLRAALAI